MKVLKGQRWKLRRYPYTIVEVVSDPISLENVKCKNVMSSHESNHYCFCAGCQAGVVEYLEGQDKPEINL